MAELFACRQPIFDRKLNLVGYELLYRDFDTDHARFVDGDLATSQVLINTYTEVDQPFVTGGQAVFINVTRNFITGKYTLPAHTNRLVLEIPNNIPFDQDLIESIKTLSNQGFGIALDDVSRPQLIQPLLSLADIVKIDLVATDRVLLPGVIEYLRRQASRSDRDLKLLAEKIETQEEFDLCMQFGFDYFQGYFLCKPKIERSRRLPPSRLVILRLLDRVQDPQIDFGALEELIAQDPLLSYKLLRLVNSTFIGVPEEVKSIRQGMALLGLEQLRAWLMLFFISQLDDKPRELSILAMIRAKMCEILAKTAHEHHPDAFFLVGLLSTIDALMDQPMETLLQNLRLSPAVLQALLNHKGRLGEALLCVLAYERADWDTVKFAGLSTGLVRYIYIEALGWVSNMQSALGF